MVDKNEQDFEDEIEFTDEDGESSAGDKVKKLKAELKTAKEDSQKNLDGWQRALADYANLQKNSTDQMKELKGYVLQGFIEDLLPVLDSFEMAMKNRESWEAVPENWRKGVEYIYNQLCGVMNSYGVEEIPATGWSASGGKDKFNPEYHYAVEEVLTDDAKKDHQISEIIQKGYRTTKSVIRPAQVKIFIKNLED